MGIHAVRAALRGGRRCVGRRVGKPSGTRPPCAGCSGGFYFCNAAAAVAERFVPMNQVWTCAAAGVFVGIMTGHALDTVRALAPKVLRGYLGGLAEKVTGVKDDGKD